MAGFSFDSAGYDPQVPDHAPTTSGMAVPDRFSLACGQENPVATKATASTQRLHRFIDFTPA
jgi:hypothetical protein